MKHFLLLIQGYLSAVQIRGTIWLDADANGLMTTGERSLAGVQVKAYDAQQQVVAKAVSDASGGYFAACGEWPTGVGPVLRSGGWFGSGGNGFADDLPLKTM